MTRRFVLAALLLGAMPLHAQRILGSFRVTEGP